MRNIRKCSVCQYISLGLFSHSLACFNNKNKHHMSILLSRVALAARFSEHGGMRALRGMRSPACATRNLRTSAPMAFRSSGLKQYFDRSGSGREDDDGDSQSNASSSSSTTTTTTTKPLRNLEKVDSPRRPRNMGGGRGEVGLREALSHDPLDIAPPEVDNWNMLFDFSDPSTVSSWVWASDKDIGGESTCELEHVEGPLLDPPEWADETPISGSDMCIGSGYARFFGNLSLDFTGSATRSGYAMARSQEPLQPLDLGEYKGLAMRVRSPLPYQRLYGINVRTESFLPDEVYIGALQLNSPGWVTVQLPFESFTLTGRGHIRAIQRPMPTHEFLTVGFACTEKVPGPYHLDVAWIAAVRNMLGDEDVLKMNYSGGVLDAASGIIR